MTQKRPTLVSVFKSAGYRTVAVMPGLRQAWPEGAFYGFDEIYGAEASTIAVRGFGWWRIPDQFSLAALDARELQPQPRKPAVRVLSDRLDAHAISSRSRRCSRTGRACCRRIPMMPRRCGVR